MGYRAAKYGSMGDQVLGLEVLKKIEEALDPDNIMNPGKLALEH